MLGVLTSLLLFPGVSQASSGELQLVNTIEDLGIEVIINGEVCRELDIDGAYNHVRREFHICQDNYRGNGIVPMTNNDLDTIRHEAVHVIQDCLVGGIGDRRVDVIFQDEDEQIGFVSRSLPLDQIKAIVRSYAESGLNAREIGMELEAFSIAGTVPAEAINEALKDACMVK